MLFFSDIIHPSADQAEATNYFIRVHISVLVTKCKFLEASNYIYKTFLPLTELKAQTEEYYARMVFYVQGARDANIIFTVTNRPNFEQDAVYEFGMNTMKWLFVQKYSLFAFHLS